MKMYPQFISALVSLFCLVHYSRGQKDTKLEDIEHGSSRKDCLARDGRDGRPGLQGPIGQPGRDGRDCTNTLVLDRLFDLEKRLGQLGQKYQLMEMERRKMNEKIEAYRVQNQNILIFLAAKKIIDPDLIKILGLHLPAETPSTDVESEENPTTGIPTTEVPTGHVIQNVTGKTTPKVKTSYSTTEQVKTPRHIYIKVIKSQTKQTPSESVTKPTVSDTKNNCRKRFHVQQKVPTRGAVDMEVFVAANITFLAVANFHSSSSNGYNAKSFVYKMNPESDEFELFQELITIGCRAMVAFTNRGESYLVAANHYDGTTFNLHSVIYKWNGTQFESFRKVPTSGASAAQYFTVAGESYLMFANYRNDTTVLVSSVIYKWRPGGNLELFQNLQTHGAVDCQFYESQYGGFLVFANYYTPETTYNVVYKWNGTLFVFLQNILTSASTSVDMFEEKASLFLAIANNRDDESWHSQSTIFRWSGESFQSFQQITTTAAVKVNHFFDPQGALYLTIANYFDESTAFETHSMVYKFNGRRFVKFQGVLTTGAYDLQPFTYKGVPYLASAFRYNGINNNIESKIYKMTMSCQTDDDLLP